MMSRFRHNLLVLPLLLFLLLSVCEGRTHRRRLVDVNSLMDGQDLSDEQSSLPARVEFPYHGSNTTNMSSFLKLRRFMAQYRAQHSSEALRRESPLDFCARKFSYSGNEGDNCLGGIGNVMGGFFEDVMFAVVTNRTFFVQSRVPAHPDCAAGFTFNSWIPTFSEISRLAHSANCSDPGMASGVAATTPPDKTLDSTKCGSLHDPAVFVRTLHGHHNQAVFHYHSYVDSSLSPTTVERIKTLFVDTYQDDARFHSYGFMQLYALNFTPPVRHLVEQGLANTLQVPNSIRISVHMRHYARKNKTELEREYSARGDALVFPEIESFRKTIPVRELTCIIYAASEYEFPIARLAQEAQKYNCTTLTVDKSNQYHLTHIDK